MWLRGSWVAVALVLGVWGCGGKANEGGAEVAATQSDMQSFCDTICDWQLRCDFTGEDETLDECVTDCMEDSPRIVGTMRRDVITGTTDCYTGMACNEREEACIMRAAEAAGLTVESLQNHPDVKACEAKQDECADTASSFSDDICSYQMLFVTSKQREVMKCFDGSCDAVRACVAPYQ